ncbi:MAG TPA: methyltransferase domain-containing protein [Frankiaceae bacterium]|nr:methyltransferase domain-containing protein [Frankiaceae bacterium]
MAVESDLWSRWLLDRRDAGDADQRDATLERLARVREQVLKAAGSLDGATLLDVGCGDGLIGLRALDLVGSHGTVIFADVSDALIEYCREAARARGALDRARFVLAGAEDLAGIAAASVDVVTTRSVLIYVEDKARALSAMHRVLRPGGRISLFEPINRLMFPEPEDRFWGYDVTGVTELAAKVKAIFGRSEQPGAVAAMMGFDDRDLVRLAERAGFDRVHVECHIDVEPGSLMHSVTLAALLGSAPNPNAPTVGEAIAAALTEPERRRFVAGLEQAFREDRAVRRMAVAYVAACKRQ